MVSLARTLERIDEESNASGWWSVALVAWIALAVLLPLVCGYALWFRAPANAASRLSGPAPPSTTVNSPEETTTFAYDFGPQSGVGSSGAG